MNLIVLGVRVMHVAYLVVILAMLAACGSSRVKPSEGAAAEVSREHQNVPVAQSSNVKRLSARERVIGELLLSAQQAFRENRLTTPSHDNAYDLFQSVLTLDPENSSARAGVQAILISYADWSRTAIAEREYSKAQDYLNLAQIYFPANPLLLELQQKLREDKRLRARVEQQVLVSEPAPERVEYSLPGLALKKKSPAVADYLARLAKRIQASDESVMIYARSDSEGRWIYQQLNQATEGYRVRGDIRIASAPKIVLMPPL